MQCTSLGMLIRKGIVYLLALDFFLGIDCRQYFRIPEAIRLSLKDILIGDLWQQNFQNINKLRVAVNLATNGGSLVTLGNEVLRIGVLRVLDHHNGNDRAQDNQRMVSLSLHFALYVGQGRNVGELEQFKRGSKMLIVKLDQLIDMIFMNVEVARRVQEMVQIDARRSPVALLEVDLKRVSCES